MESFADERDRKLLEQDKFAFFVLARILGGPCNLLLTDHERLIICHSCPPYPVWIWTADDATEAERKRAYELAEEHGLLAEGQTFNMKYDLAAYFLARAAEDGRHVNLQTNMFAYACPHLIAPHVRADGGMQRCNADELAEFFRRETGIDRKTREAYRRESEAAIRTGAVFFWRNAEGRNVAVCSLRPNGTMASVGLVYTRVQDRRRHYAENLVYEVTKIATEAGYTPMLYTDADYVASNACYTKIGYVLRGKLCNLKVDR